MSGQGYHFAIDRDQLGELLACTEEMAVWEYVDGLEEAWDDDDDNRAGGHKRWPILQECLSDASLAGSKLPLKRCFLGGRRLSTEVSLVMPAEVRELSGALGNVTKDWFRARYLHLFGHEYPDKNAAQADAEEIWPMLDELRTFYRKAADDGRAVIFYTDEPLEYSSPEDST